MKKIMLVCSAGMSTSLLVNKIKKAADEQGVEADVFAVAELEAKSHTDVDVILLGPQVRFTLPKMVEFMKPYNVPVDVINTVAYGSLNGKVVLEQALSLMK